MSTTIDADETVFYTPQSSKKRKINGETPLKSAKKRKHDNSQDATLESVTLSAPSTIKVQKKEKKSRRDHSLDQTPSQIKQTDNHEFTDLPTSATIESEPMVVDSPLTNAEQQPTEESEHIVLDTKDPSCFYSSRMSFYVPIPGISLSTSISSLLSLHLAPLLLTYFAPVEGVILSFSDPILSAKPDTGVNLPLRQPKNDVIPRSPPDENFARCADEFGVCWVWLTVTLLVFKPQPGDKLKGWTNVQSEGFVGLVSYNYFQSAIGKTRIPKSWTWDGPTQAKGKRRLRPKKTKLRDENDMMIDRAFTPSDQQPNGGEQQHQPEEEEETEPISYGSFLDETGTKVEESQTFTVVDIEMVPGHDRNSWSLQIDGSLLSQQDEAVILEEERRRFEMVQSRSRSKTPAGIDDRDLPLMSGGLVLSREPSILRD